MEEKVMDAIMFASEIEQKTQVLKSLASGFEFLMRDIREEATRVNNGEATGERLEELMKNTQKIMEKYPFVTSQRVTPAK